MLLNYSRKELLGVVVWLPTQGKSSPPQPGWWLATSPFWYSSSERTRNLLGLPSNEPSPVPGSKISPPSLLCCDSSKWWKQQNHIPWSFFLCTKEAQIPRWCCAGHGFQSLMVLGTSRGSTLAGSVLHKWDPQEKFGFPAMVWPIWKNSREKMTLSHECSPRLHRPWFCFLKNHIMSSTWNCDQLQLF